MDRIGEILEKLYEEGSFEGECRDIHPDRIVKGVACGRLSYNFK